MYCICIIPYNRYSHSLIHARFHMSWIFRYKSQVSTHYSSSPWQHYTVMSMAFMSNLRLNIRLDILVIGFAVVQWIELQKNYRWFMQAELEKKLVHFMLWESTPHGAVAWRYWNTKVGKQQTLRTVPIDAKIPVLENKLQQQITQDEVYQFWWIWIMYLYPNVCANKRQQSKFALNSPVFGNFISSLQKPA